VITLEKHCQETRALNDFPGRGVGIEITHAVRKTCSTRSVSAMVLEALFGLRPERDRLRSRGDGPVRGVWRRDYGKDPG
jgi:hypothetical protein